MISTSEFKQGLKILLNGEPCEILHNEFVKPGKGQAFSRVKLQNLITSKIWDKTFKSSEKVEEADIFVQEMTYLYTDSEIFFFMEPKTYEQHEVPLNILKDCKCWLKEQESCEVVFWGDRIIKVTPANFVVLKVVETEPSIKGDTVSGGTKVAKLEGGGTIRVPLFINVGDQLKIDTRDGSYCNREK